MRAPPARRRHPAAAARCQCGRSRQPHRLRLGHVVHRVPEAVAGGQETRLHEGPSFGTPHRRCSWHRRSPQASSGCTQTMRLCVHCRPVYAALRVRNSHSDSPLESSAASLRVWHHHRPQGFEQLILLWTSNRPCCCRTCGLTRRTYGGGGWWLSIRSFCSCFREPCTCLLHR